MHIRRILLAAAAVATLIPVAGYAHKAIEDTIEARRGFYQLVGFNTHKLAEMAKGGVAYDAATAENYARNLRLLTEMESGALWPEGSDNLSKPGLTRAKPEIWTTWPAIAGKVDDWKAAVVQLDANAGAGLEALRGAMGPLGQSCKGCHQDFRAKDF